MYVSKTKDYSSISLNDIKEDLKIDSADNSYNNELQRLIKSAVSEAENFIHSDIVQTTTILTDYHFHGNCYQILEAGITVNSVVADGVDITGFTIQKHIYYTNIILPFSISSKEIIISFQSGSEEVKPDILKAIHLKVGEYFDADRNGYVSGSIKETKAFERILSTYKNLIY